MDPFARLAIFVPAAAATPVEALAEALFAEGAAPELADGDFATPGALAAHFDRGGGPAPVLAALGRAGEAVRAQEGRGAAPAVRLTVIVDQMEQLFGADMPGHARAAFANLLETLAQAEGVAVVATLRADARASALEEPALRRLIDEGATLSLARPGPDALAEIIRGPAQAAGLAFGTDAAGDRLDEILLRDAGGADSLPLLQFTLDELFRAARARAGEDKAGAEADDDSAAGAITLSCADYTALGGLDGAIGRQADAALAGCPPEAQRALPALVRRLADIGRNAETGETALLLRPARESASDAGQRALANALVTARIAVRDGETIRFAHEKVIRSWPPAARAARESETFLRVRGEIERDEAVWRKANRPRSLLLPRGVRLAEAEEVAAAHGDELTGRALRYVAASRRRARLGQTLTAAAAAVFAMVAAGAGWFYSEAVENERIAEENAASAEAALRTATNAANTLVFDLAQEFKGRGLPISITTTILERARALQDGLAENFPDDPLLARSRAGALLNAGDLLFRAGDSDGAGPLYQDALEIARRLAEVDPDNAGWARDVFVSLNKIGDLRLRSGDAAGAGRAYEEGLEILRRLAEGDPDNADWARDVSVSLNKIGDLRLRSGDAAGAGRAYEEGLEIRHRLAEVDPDNADWARDVSVSLNKIGDLRLRSGDAAGAGRAYEEGLEIRRRLAEGDPDNAGWARDVSVSLNKIGDLRLRSGDAAGAGRAYEEGLEIARRLAEGDPDNAGWAWDVVVSNWKLAQIAGEDAAERWEDVVQRLEAMKARGILAPDDERFLPVARANLEAARAAQAGE